MKKMIVFLLALSVLSSITLAQDVKWQRNIDAIGTCDVQSSTGVYYGPGLRYHVLSWQIVDGSISAGTIKLEKSVDVITWADLIHHYRHHRNPAQFQHVPSDLDYLSRSQYAGQIRADGGL